MGSDNYKQRFTSWMPRWMSLPLIIIVAFLIIMFFYGDNSYLKSISYQEKINKLNAEIKANEDSAAFYEKKVLELTTDPEGLEKIAREQYGMKRENEDVYITEIP